jgi:hypothetical protein
MTVVDTGHDRHRQQTDYCRDNDCLSHDHSPSVPLKKLVGVEVE